MESYKQCQHGNPNQYNTQASNNNMRIEDDEP